MFDGYESHNTINKHSQDKIVAKNLLNVLGDNKMNNNYTPPYKEQNLCITII